jgi:hypothetical protein
LGLIRDVRRRFRVIVAWGTSLSHRCIGKLGSVVARPAMKWFLNVRMARSAAFARWTPGGTNWYWMCSVSMYRFSTAEHSLSIRCSLGRRPARMRVLTTAVYAARISFAVLVGIGTACIELLSWSYNTNIWVFPALEGVGKRPV